MNAPANIRASDIPRAAKKPRRNEEHDLQVAVANVLRLSAAPGTFYCAIPNGGGRSKREGARLKAEGVIAGAPDLLVLVKGCPYGLELKTRRGRQSPEQKAVEKAWFAAGGYYIVAHGIDEAMTFLRTVGAIRARLT